MFSKMFATVSVLIAISMPAYAAKNDPRIELRGGGPDYASVINHIALKDKSRPDNAAPLYIEAFKLYKPEPPQMFSLRLWQGWPTELRDEKRTAIDEWLKANEPAITKLKEGSKMSFFWLTYPADIPLGTGPLSTYTQVNSLASAICWQAKIKAADGDIDGAFEDVLSAYRFGQQIIAPPHTLAEQTTGFSIQTTALWTATQIIAHATVNAEELGNFQKALMLARDNQNFYFDLTAAKLWITDAIERTFTADGSVSKLQLDAMQRSLNLSSEDMSRWENLDKAQTASMSRQLFASLEPALKKMPWQLKKESININAQIDQMTSGNVLLEHYRPDLGNNIDLPHRCKAQAEAVITICAVKRYAADNKTMPPSLKTLTAAGFLRDEPQDPYNNGPLGYIAVPDNFKLYSWGADFRDNYARPSKWGEGPDGGDEVFWPIP